MESPACDADGRHDGYGIEAAILRACVEGGETLVRRRPRRADSGLPVPLQIQVLEPDFFDQGKNAQAGKGQRRIVQGVEFDRLGQRVGYWLHSDHPGEQLSARGYSSKRYNAADFAHVFRQDRPGQVHGVPWGTGAMTRLKMLDDYQDAQLERQRLAACYMGFRRVPDPALTDGKHSLDEYTLLEKLEPGAIDDLPPGWDIDFATPPQPEDDKDFLLAVLRAVAADYGIPYEILTGDLSEVNFSSARMGWNEFSRNIDTWRWQMLIPQALAPIVGWFREAASLVGVPIQQEQPLWTAPARTMVDSTKEVPALIKAVRAGLLSMPEAIRQQGYDPDVLLAEQADWLAKLTAAGVLLDTDPRADVARQSDQEAITEVPDANEPE